MAVHIYVSESEAPEEVASLLEPDATTCEIGITCYPAAPIGWHLAENHEGREHIEWTVVVALKATGDEPPVLCCEDCYGWLADALGHSDVQQLSGTISSSFDHDTDDRLHGRT